MPGYVPETAAEFAQSKACFAEAVGWLAGPEAAALTHAELEEHLGERGRELLRCLHQDHLTRSPAPAVTAAPQHQPQQPGHWCPDRPERHGRGSRARPARPPQHS